MTHDRQTNKLRNRGTNPLPERQMRILLVDDDSDILQLLKTVLSQEGYKVETASDGDQALELLDEFSPDLMCIDYLMPEPDGQELARRIRERRDMLYVPIIMLTAAGDKSDVKLTSLSSGVDAYLTKPISRDELKVTIRTLLRVKVAQDRMLDALERVAEVQDELLVHERQQGQSEAMQVTIATVRTELNLPLQNAQAITTKLEKMLQTAKESNPAQAVFLAQVDQIQQALGQMQAVIERLGATTEFNTKEGQGEEVLLDLN